MEKTLFYCDCCEKQFDPKNQPVQFGDNEWKLVINITVSNKLKPSTWRKADVCCKCKHRLIAKYICDHESTCPTCKE